MWLLPRTLLCFRFLSSPTYFIVIKMFGSNRCRIVGTSNSASCIYKVVFFVYEYFCRTTRKNADIYNYIFRWKLPIVTGPVSAYSASPSLHSKVTFAGWYKGRPVQRSQHQSSKTNSADMKVSPQTSQCDLYSSNKCYRASIGLRFAKP